MEEIKIANEFAFVELRKVETSHGALLEIEDKKNDRKILLDAMQLESLTLMRPEDFSFFFETHYGVNDPK
jgi:hypothetical protein